MEMESIRYLVVGIGINVKGTDFPPELKERAVSLCMILGRPLHRAELIARTLKHFEQDYQVFLQTEDLSGLLEDYTSRLVNNGRQVPGESMPGENCWWSATESCVRSMRERCRCGASMGIRSRLSLGSIA